jgi:hypothetical protein
MTDLEQVKYDSVIAMAPLTDEKGGKSWVMIARRNGKNEMLILPIGEFQMQYIELDNATSPELPA